ncbi:MAG: Co2+/Mg2+ efflux protein ApaG [Sphingomonadales bacterium]
MLPFLDNDFDGEDMVFDYVESTDGITISAQPIFMDDESDPDEHQYVWAYTIRIDNDRAQDIELRTRHWRIIDSNGRCEKVDGDGVVGEQPIIKPGESFEYTSCCPLKTASGLMDGSYDFRVGNTTETIPVPRFSLDSPYSSAVIN